MSRALFVSAIGTDCGKTHVAAALLRELRRRGHSVMAVKPLMSGYSHDALESSDAGRLLAACGQAVTEQAIEDVCWKRFTEWSAPNVAARRAGVALSYRDLVAFVRRRLEQCSGIALVEGAGGVMSPLTDTHTNIDLMADLGLPVLLMASNYLGAVSHTLTALQALERAGIEVAMLGVTQALPNAGPAAPLIDELTRWTTIPIFQASFSKSPSDDSAWASPLVEQLLG
jgi:dethiobiotin synthetase